MTELLIHRRLIMEKKVTINIEIIAIDPPSL